MILLTQIQSSSIDIESIDTIHVIDQLDIDTYVIDDLAFTDSKQQHLLNSNASAAILFKDSRGGLSFRSLPFCSQFILFRFSAKKLIYCFVLTCFFILVKDTISAKAMLFQKVVLWLKEKLSKVQPQKL